MTAVNLRIPTFPLVPWDVWGAALQEDLLALKDGSARKIAVDVSTYVQDGSADETAAIAAAVADVAAGGTLVFPRLTFGQSYRTSDTVLIDKANVRLLGGGRDAYAANIQGTTAGMDVVTVKAPGFVLDGLGIIGADGNVTNGAGATMTGLHLYGDTDGNIDARITGASFQYLAVGVRTRARNATITGETSFSNCLKGVVIDGIDATYHTGPNASQNRGNTIRGARFHNIGAANTDSAVEITSTAKVLHALIATSYFDSNGLGVHVRATGTSTDPHKALTIQGNKHAETRSDVYVLTYVNDSSIRDADISGYAGVEGSQSNGVVLTHCDSVRVEHVAGVQLGASGVVARNSTRCRIASVAWRSIGTDASLTGHGFDIDNTCDSFIMDDLSVDSTDGWGFTGAPLASTLGAYSFQSCTLGGINSTSLAADNVFVPASTFSPITGTPNLAGVIGVGYPMAYQFDQTTVELVASSIPALPNSWRTFDAWIVWAGSNGSAGNVVWDLNYAFIVDGQLTNNGNVGNPGTAQSNPGVAGKASFYKIASGKTRSTAPMVLRVDRNAASASDTYPADAQLIGVQLVRAS